MPTRQWPDGLPTKTQPGEDIGRRDPNSRILSDAGTARIHRRVAGSPALTMRCTFVLDLEELAQVDDFFHITCRDGADDFTGLEHPYRPGVFPTWSWVGNNPDQPPLHINKQWHVTGVATLLLSADT